MRTRVIEQTRECFSVRVIRGEFRAQTAHRTASAGTAPERGHGQTEDKQTWRTSHTRAMQSKDSNAIQRSSLN